MRLNQIFPVIVLLLTIVTFPSFMPNTPVEASVLLQSLPNLNGTNIYFTEANSEASRFDQLDSGLSRFAGLLRLQGANLFTLEWRSRFPTDADLIIVAGPVTDFTPDQTARLWAYTINGGNLLLMANPTGLSSTQWAVTSGFFSLMWSDLNLRALNDVVVTEFEQLPSVDPEATEEPTDANVTRRSTDELTSRFETNDFASDHPITENLSAPLQFFRARSLQYDASPRDYTVTPLIFSDSSFYGETQFAAYLADGTFAYNINSDTARGPLLLAVALEDPRSATRIVLMGDRNFATNGSGFLTSPLGSASFLYPDNVRFMLNAVAWLTENDVVEVEFPTPGPSATPSLTPTLTPTPSPTPDAPTATPNS